MPDLSRARTARHVDADGTQAEDDRQLTELILENAVIAQPRNGSSAAEKPALLARILTVMTVLVAVPVSLFVYSAARDEDDFYS